MDFSMDPFFIVFWVGHGFFFDPWIRARIFDLNFSMDFFMEFFLRPKCIKIQAKTTRNKSMPSPKNHEKKIHGKIHDKILDEIRDRNRAPKPCGTPTPQAKNRSHGHGRGARRVHPQERPRKQSNFVFMALPCRSPSGLESTRRANTFT